MEQFTLYTWNLITLEKHKDVECVLNCLAMSAIIDQTRMISQEFFSVVRTCQTCRKPPPEGRQSNTVLGKAIKQGHVTKPFACFSRHSLTLKVTS